MSWNINIYHLGLNNFSKYLTQYQNERIEEFESITDGVYPTETPFINKYREEHKEDDEILEDWSKLCDKYMHELTEEDFDHLSKYHKYYYARQEFLEQRTKYELEYSLYKQKVDNYIKNRCIMTIPIIKETWEDFLIKYKKYSKNPRDVWFRSFQRVKDYLKEYGKLPSGDSTDKEIRYLGRWIGCQNTNLRKSEHSMNDPEFKQLWIEFITANLG